MPQQYRVLAAYNRQVNRQFYAACATLTAAELKRDRGAFFKSIYGTLNHLLLVDRLWLGSFTGDAVAFAALQPATLEAPFNERLTFPTWLAVTHFFNHQTHHRGQLSALLSQCGVDYGITDLRWVDGVAALA